ncbi:aldehyde dehydrogenase family protein [Candidatus Dojkabacteria bacterium]|uniref:Aldehyde dehydrogenase family protein n=1 Tax=Candidatus Dojkabacteria bacterium TaxID=2099670 RepID=A0A955I9S0_9BACT|nr:aldehyde dehydrogenase family protein [Candidatus Dojkabacteria bacterium]
MENQDLIVNGQNLSGDNGTIEIKSPWDLQTFASVASASKAQVEDAVSNSDEAFHTWRYSSLSERVEIFNNAIKSLREDSDRLAQLLHKEIGKFEDDARSEINRSIDYMELMISALKHWKGTVYYGDLDPKFPRNKKTGIYSRVPLGVVLAISPFNYPINLSITKIAPALLSGNTVVLKPSTQGAYTSYEFYKHFAKAGLPKGVLNIVSGSSKEIGDPLLTHPLVKLIAFTGSTEVGNHIRKVSLGVPLLLELGGKDIGVVTKHADLDLAVKEIVKGAFSYCGQRCTAQKLALVHSSKYEEFTRRVVEEVQKLELNPMIDEPSASFVMELFNDATSKGAEVKVSPNHDSNKLSPAVVSEVKPEMRVFYEEQFGPLMPIGKYETEEELLKLVNGSPYGLQASVYTKDIDQAFRLADKIEVGTVQINAKPDRGPDNFPFGGVKDSGQLMQGTIETLDLMTRGKMVVVNT